MSTVLIIGAGPNVGKACAEAFYTTGCKVAVASRTQKLDSKYHYYPFDASKPDTVPSLFERVSADLGIPSVVIYNSWSILRALERLLAPRAVSGRVTVTDANKPFENGLDSLQMDLNINTVSAYAAASETVKGFDRLGTAGLGPAGGTFIFTGNCLNVGAVAGFMAFGMAKSAGAHMIQHLALAAFADKPYKFYYADERHEDGTYMSSDLNGAVHGETYLELAKDPTQRAWDYTFVKGKGYVEFPRQELWLAPSRG